jgi:hypothetical protein
MATVDRSAVALIRANLTIVREAGIGTPSACRSER